jgi:hypothetical protein
MQKLKARNSKTTDQLHILLVGNNPIDMGHILQKLNQISSARVITEIAFDVKSILERLMKFKPNYIFIDDNIGKAQLYQTVDALSHRHKTRNIPITVLKNSNYEESYVGESILDYMLKANLSADSIYHTVRNSLRFKKTQMYLYKAYHRRGSLLKRITGGNQI